VRSTRLLVLAAAGAVAVGAAAALLKPAEPVVGPGNLAVRAENPPTVDASELQRKLLDRLVQDAAVADPAGLPALTTFTSLFTHGQDWVLDRLLRDDVPSSLALAFADRLPRGAARSDSAVDRLLGPMLAAISQGDRRAAVDVLRARGRLPTDSAASCRCVFGVHDGAAGRTAVAVGAAPGVLLTWSPQVVGDDLVLHVAQSADGSHVLSRPMDVSGALHAEALPTSHDEVPAQND